jgi:hypothetical protein
VRNSDSTETLFALLKGGVDSAGGSLHYSAVRIMDTGQFILFIYDLLPFERKHPDAYVLKKIIL